MKYRAVLLFAALALFGSDFAPRAEAGSPYGFGYCGYLNRNGYSDLAIPYFSQFPPVYYSHPVPRPYGWSPYAYPPGVLTPSAGLVEPETIINPHVTPPSVPAEGSGPTVEPTTTAVKPQVLINPYVETHELVSLPIDR